MPRNVRNTALLAKIETTYNTDPTPTGGANAVLLSNFNVSPFVSANVDRALVRPFLGGSEQLPGTRYAEVSFEVEIAGSGAAGTAPAWGPLLRACGFAETISAGNRVEYTPVSTGFESVTIYVNDDGLQHKMTGARGTVAFDMQLGNRPVMRFTFRGNYSTPTAVALPSVTLTSWVRPLVINDTNTGDISLGATISTGTLTGGTAYPSRGLTVDVGNAFPHVPLLGSESVDITDRQVVGAMELDLTAAQEASLMASVEAASTTSVGFIHGTAAGNIIVLHSPVMQLFNPSKADYNGRRLIGFDARFVPSSGNDELRLVAR